MVKTLHPIGDISSRISLASGGRIDLVRDAGGVGVPVAVDPVEATKQALTAPLEFPPLASSMVPGDRVAIAVDAGVPCAPAVVRGVVEALRAANVKLEAISVVTADVETSLRCRAEFAEGDANSPQFVVHDSQDTNNLCFVGLREKEGPLFVNRTIYDADVVLPIGCARVDGYGVFDGLYPQFSNTEAKQPFLSPAGRDSVVDEATKSSITEEAGWLIGAPLILQVVPGPSETVAHVVAGEPEAVEQRVEELCEQLWSYHVPQRANLVIATLTGGATAQTWNNVARALVTADRLVEGEGSAVAICTNLDQGTGESLGRLFRSTDLDKTARKILHDHAEDSWPALQLVRALQRGPVYLLSQLDAERVEDMGLAPVANLEELARLAGRYESCIVLDDAQHVAVRVEGESV